VRAEARWIAEDRKAGRSSDRASAAIIDRARESGTKLEKSQRSDPARGSLARECAARAFARACMHAVQRARTYAHAYTRARMHTAYISIALLGRGLFHRWLTGTRP